MIKLANGRGQLGSELKEAISARRCAEDAYVYHTWNIDNKSEEAQRKEYNKFLSFVDERKEAKIIFVSTTSQKSSWYVYYKHLSESYLLLNCERGLIIRLPTLIGKGILQKLKNKEAPPYGIMELMTIGQASELILDLVSHQGLNRCLSYEGEKMKASTVQQILFI